MPLEIPQYNAPLTGGNFLDLCRNGFYNGMQIQRSDGFVIQTGDPDGEDGPLYGYTPSGASEPRKIPLEIQMMGADESIYGGTSEDEGIGKYPTALPFQSTGALGMARNEFEPDSASSQFFWLLFESDLTPAGKNMMDGRYTCFGYTIDGADFLKDVKQGDVISKASVRGGAQMSSVK